MAAEVLGAASPQEQATTPNKHDFAPPLMSVAEAADITLDAGHEDFHAQLAATMAAHGVVRVLGALTPAECAEAEAAMGRDLASTVDAQALASAPSTLQKHCKKLVQPGNLLGQWPLEAEVGTAGMACGLALPAGSFAWSLRLHPAVKGMFATLHETAAEDMVVSMDNPFFSPASARASQKQECWMHADVNSSVHPQGCLPSFQGVVYVWDATDRTHSTTVVVPGSHADGAFAALMEDAVHSGGRSHFSKVHAMGEGAARDALVRDVHARARRVPMPAGSVLLWDSRVLHQGWRGGARLAQAVAWEPADRRTPAAHCRKVGAALAGVATTHWASMGAWHSLGKWFVPTKGGPVPGSRGVIVPPTHTPCPWSVAAPLPPSAVQAAGTALKALGDAAKGAQTAKCIGRAQTALADLGVPGAASLHTASELLQAAAELLKPEVAAAL